MAIDIGLSVLLSNGITLLILPDSTLMEVNLSLSEHKVVLSESEKSGNNVCTKQISFNVVNHGDSMKWIYCDRKHK